MFPLKLKMCLKFLKKFWFVKINKFYPNNALHWVISVKIPYYLITPRRCKKPGELQVELFLFVNSFDSHNPPDYFAVWCKNSCRQRLCCAAYLSFLAGPRPARATGCCTQSDWACAVALSMRSAHPGITTFQPGLRIYLLVKYSTNHWGTGGAGTDHSRTSIFTSLSRPPSSYFK